jgi:hypothetical protein
VIKDVGSRVVAADARPGDADNYFSVIVSALSEGAAGEVGGAELLEELFADGVVGGDEKFIAGNEFFEALGRWKEVAFLLVAKAVGEDEVPYLVVLEELAGYKVVNVNV